MNLPSSPEQVVFIADAHLGLPGDDPRARNARRSLRLFPKSIPSLHSRGPFRFLVRIPYRGSQHRSRSSLRAPSTRFYRSKGHLPCGQPRLLVRVLLERWDRDGTPSGRPHGRTSGNQDISPSRRRALSGRPRVQTAKKSTAEPFHHFHVPPHSSRSRRPHCAHHIIDIPQIPRAASRTRRDLCESFPNHRGCASIRRFRCGGLRPLPCGAF